MSNKKKRKKERKRKEGVETIKLASFFSVAN